MKNSLLIVAIDYPPRPGPGANRNYYIHKHFTELGWHVNSVTLNKSNISKRDNSHLPLDYVVEAAGPDATKVLSIFGKYPKFIELPDRWYLWIVPAVIQALKVIKKGPKPHYIYGTFPTYSSLMAATIISKISGIPLIVDLRDPFRFRYDGGNVPVHWLYRRLESFALKQARILIATTEKTLTWYKNLYPHIYHKSAKVIPNGIDDLMMSIMETHIPVHQNKQTLLHSGNLYQIGRNPEALLRAIARLHKDDIISRHNFSMIFRGATPWPELTELIQHLEITHLIQFLPSVDFKDSLTEIINVDINILIQNQIFISQVPSKLYNTIASKKPLIAITPKNSALAAEMQRLSCNHFSEDIDEIATMIKDALFQRVTFNPVDYKQITRKNLNMQLSQFLLSIDSNGEPSVKK